MSYDRERAADLVLALMNLTLHDGSRAWKSYDWDVMALLHERGLISDPQSKAKSVALTDEGLARSQEMFSKYLAGCARTRARGCRRHHRLADRVRAHIFLCLLAYYVEWHMREAWRELMFADADTQAKATRDPVAPATRSKAALAKVARHTLEVLTTPNVKQQRALDLIQQIRV